MRPLIWGPRAPILNCNVRVELQEGCERYFRSLVLVVVSSPPGESDPASSLRRTPHAAVLTL